MNDLRNDARELAKEVTKLSKNQSFNKFKESMQLLGTLQENIIRGVQNVRLAHLPTVKNHFDKHGNGMTLNEFIGDVFNIGKSTVDELKKIEKVLHFVPSLLEGNAAHDIRNYKRVKNDDGKYEYVLKDGVKLTFEDDKPVYTKMELEVEEKKEAIQTNNRVSIDLEIQEVPKTASDVFRIKIEERNKVIGEIQKRVEKLNALNLEIAKMNLKEITE
jgi:hypothetical protein